MFDDYSIIEKINFHTEIRNIRFKTFWPIKRRDFCCILTGLAIDQSRYAILCISVDDSRYDKILIIFLNWKYPKLMICCYDFYMCIYAQNRHFLSDKSIFYAFVIIFPIYFMTVPSFTSSCTIGMCALVCILFMVSASTFLTWLLQIWNFYRSFPFVDKRVHLCVRSYVPSQMTSSRYLKYLWRLTQKCHTKFPITFNNRFTIKSCCSRF